MNSESSEEQENKLHRDGQLRQISLNHKINLLLKTSDVYT